MTSARAPSKHRLDKPKSVAAFRKWLATNGAEVLAPTNPYEVVRFRSGSGVSVVYRCERTRHNSMTNQAEAAWAAFKEGEALDLAPAVVWRPIAISDADLLAHAAREPITIAFLMERDAVPMRAAVSRLFGLERDGLLARSAAPPHGPITWARKEGLSR